MIILSKTLVYPHESKPNNSEDSSKEQINSNPFESKQGKLKDENITLEVENRDDIENLKDIKKTEDERAKRLHEDLKKISTIQLDYSRKLRGK